MLNFWFLIIGVVILDLIAMTLGKAYTLSKNPWFFGIAMLSSALMSALFILSLQYKGLAIANIIWAALILIANTSIAYFYFKEAISLMQFVGIALVLVGMILVNK